MEYTSSKSINNRLPFGATVKESWERITTIGIAQSYRTTLDKEHVISDGKTDAFREDFW
ncbi:MAG: hypothetical protein ACW99G_11460 [Candidatus Thorarchaeota archaeon]|jgi:hypothetical protein